MGQKKSVKKLKACKQDKKKTGEVEDFDLGFFITQINKPEPEVSKMAYRVNDRTEVEEIPNERRVWMNGRPLLRTQKCIDLGITRLLLRTKKYIDFDILHKCPFIRIHKYTDLGISRKCPLLRNLLYSDKSSTC